MHSRSLLAALLSLLFLSANALPTKGSTSRLARRARLTANNKKQLAQLAKRTDKAAPKAHTIHIEGGVSGSTINVNLGVREAKAVGDHSVLIDASSSSASGPAEIGGGVRNSTLNLTVIDSRKKKRSTNVLRDVLVDLWRRAFVVDAASSHSVVKRGTGHFEYKIVEPTTASSSKVSSSGASDHSTVASIHHRYVFTPKRVTS